MRQNDISRILLDAAIEVHRTLGGPGLLESVYEEALAWELAQRGLSVVSFREGNLAPEVKCTPWRPGIAPG